MMATSRGTFKLNRRTVRTIMREDNGLKAALHDAAEETREGAGPNATIDEYRTDRMVAGIIVPADEQARDGVATRAAQQTASRARVRPFRSRAEWRFQFSRDATAARARARVSGGYSSLPARTGGIR
jgi:hypothetical protein